MNVNHIIYDWLLSEGGLPSKPMGAYATQFDLIYHWKRIYNFVWDVLLYKVL